MINGKPRMEKRYFFFQFLIIHASCIYIFIYIMKYKMTHPLLRMGHHWPDVQLWQIESVENVQGIHAVFLFQGLGFFIISSWRSEAVS